MPNAKVDGRVEPAEADHPRPARTSGWSPRRPGAIRCGRRFEERYLGPARIRPSIPRSTACRSSPRCSTRSAAIVPTGVSHREHVDFLADIPGPAPARAPSTGRSGPSDRRSGSRPALSRSGPRWPNSSGLVAERAAAEAEAKGLAAGQRREGRRRVLQDAPEPRGRRRRRSTARPGRPTSSGGGRSSTPPCRARPGPRPSSPPPAGGSPPSSTALRETAKAELQPGEEAAAATRTTPATEGGRPDHAAAIKPMLDAIEIADGFRERLGRASPPTTASSSSIPSLRAPPARLTPSSRSRSMSSSTASHG